MKDLKKNNVIEPILLYAFYIKMKTECHPIQLKKLTVLPQNSESSQKVLEFNNFLDIVNIPEESLSLIIASKLFDMSSQLIEIDGLSGTSPLLFLASISSKQNNYDNFKNMVISKD